MNDSAIESAATEVCTVPTDEVYTVYPAVPRWAL